MAERPLPGAHHEEVDVCVPLAAPEVLVSAGTVSATP
jgi:hypothetical protein